MPPWWYPCPPGHDIGPWREACEEVARALGEEEMPLHYEDIKRTLRQLNELIRQIPVQAILR